MKKIVSNCDISLIKNTVDDVYSFNYSWFYRQPLVEHSEHETRATRNKDYVNVICTLDIETTKIEEIEQSICYIWQACINGHCVIGRTLSELKIFLDRLCKNIDDKTKIIFFIHNESFEFHHLREVIPFVDVFSIDKRKPLKACYRNIEFRCSYILSNMSLDSYLKKMGVENLKTHMDYAKKRYPWTKINAKDTEYCLHDVIGLYEAIKKHMELEGDTLLTIPLTSTGYTRRDVKNVMYKFSRRKPFHDAIPSYNVFLELYEAFRGGNTHANRWISGQIISEEDYGLIHSFDRASSYPDVLLKQKYPWKFEKSLISVDEALKIGKAILTRITLKNVRLKNKFDGCPYIPIAKCKTIEKVVEDNGRVLSADSLSMTVTDIDLKIILKTYTFDYIIYSDTYIADYKPLPKPLKDLIRKYFIKKTTLKGVSGAEDEYMKFKNRFNAIYGLMVQSPAKLLIEYDEEAEGLFRGETARTLEEVYEKNKKKLFLLYQWGVWCTAYARSELQDIIDIVQSTPGALFLYTDTDSVKFTGNVDFTDYNKKHIDLSIKCGAVAKDHKGKIHYIGVLEKEDDMSEFITHGAKKYAYVTKDDSKLHLTCAGVNKEKGTEELGSIKWFKEGFIFGEAAGLEAKYNDSPAIRDIVVNGHKLHIYSNIYLKDSTYTVSKTVKYKSLIDSLNRNSLLYGYIKHNK